MNECLDEWTLVWINNAVGYGFCDNRTEYLL
jgi:hypothetical protein